MPFEKIDVAQVINDKKNTDSEFKELWDNSRTEYKVLGELIRLRKEKGISQVELAKKSGCKQQVISRIEKRENSPTLKTLCSLADVLDVDICFVPRKKRNVTPRQP